MVNEKSALRKKLLSVRNSLPRQEISLSHLEDFEKFKNAKTVFCYVSAGSEVKTQSLIQEMLTKKRVVVPYCTDKCGNMIAVEIKSLDELKEGLFGISEPVTPKEFPKEEIDFVIVPGIAFDKDGYRLGYGKGYYDRFLRGYSQPKVLILYKTCLLKKLWHGRFDVPVDMIVTEYFIANIKHEPL